MALQSFAGIDLRPTVILVSVKGFGSAGSRDYLGFAMGLKSVSKEKTQSKN